MPLKERGESQHSGIAWIVAIPSQAEGLRPSKYHYLYLITFHIYNVSMLLGDCLQTAHLSLVISYRAVQLYNCPCDTIPCYSHNLRGSRYGTKGGMCRTQTFPKLILYLDCCDKLDIHHHHRQICSHRPYS